MAKRSLKERMREKASELKSRNSGGNMVFLKDGQTIRVRILNMGEENDFIKEVTQFYLGGEIKGVISPSTFGEPCAIFDEYQRLKNSSDEDEKKLSAKFNIRKRYLAFCAIYKDLRGKELDESPKFVLLTNGLYQSIIDYYLDEDDWGDMTDPSSNGYDLKLKRVGSGKTDTEYSVIPCSKTKAPKDFEKKVFSLDDEVRKITPTFEETEAILTKFMGSSHDEGDDDAPKSSKKVGKVKKVKRRVRDDE